MDEYVPSEAEQALRFLRLYTHEEFENSINSFLAEQEARERRMKGLRTGLRL
ncbi:MAG: hypothetical protein KGI04_02800 [Candidatus Micrarchaeota archaeon]|nr:hypothetical protein [Candidatus Micrarchaeota archaeon]